MDAVLKIVQTVNMYLSDYILIIMLIGCGLYFSFKTKFVQVRCFGEGWRKVFGNFSLHGGKHEGGIELVSGPCNGNSCAGRYRQHRRRMRRDPRRRPGRYLLDVDNRLLRHEHDLRRGCPCSENTRCQSRRNRRRRPCLLY